LDDLSIIRVLILGLGPVLQHDLQVINVYDDRMQERVVQEILSVRWVSVKQYLDDEVLMYDVLVEDQMVCVIRLEERILLLVLVIVLLQGVVV
jgi:hypothetical protein